MKIQADYHMHCCTSYDSIAKPEDMIEEAIRKGLKEICFTDHYDKDYFYKGKETIFDLEKYMQTMTVLKDRYKQRLQIRIGIELGLQIHVKEQYQQLVKQYPFDFVIGSIHCIQKKDPAEGQLFKGEKDENIYQRMFEETLINIREFTQFDVLGHLDYVVRYSNQKGEGYSYEIYKDYIDEIWKTLIEKGCGIEVNTAGLKYGLPFVHPIREALKRYQELGGEIVTIGADAHMPQHIAYEFEKARDILLQCGFQYYTVFKDRKPVFRKL